MAINKYTNIEKINNRTDNEGEFLKPEDLFIVTKEELEISEFGDSPYDVMEISIYDINNNLIPQKSGNNVAYVKSGDIKNYIYNLYNSGGQKELAIDAEKLLKDLGFSNGILKVNINFVRNQVGNENAYNKIWIQEISPSREEIRILPLKTKNEIINSFTKNQFESLIRGDREFSYYRNWLLSHLEKFENEFLTKINDLIVSKFGNEFFLLFKKDFGVSSFDAFKSRIFDNYRNSVSHYVNNRYYDIEQSNFGRPLEVKNFIDYEKYNYETINAELEKILYKCIKIEIKTLKRRNIEYESVPTEFSVVELQKSVEDNLKSFEIPTVNRKEIYNPAVAQLRRAERLETTPVPAPVSNPNLVYIDLEPDLPVAPRIPPIELPIDIPQPIEPPFITLPDPLPISREPENPIFISDTPIGLPSGGGAGSFLGEGRELRDRTIFFDEK